MRAINHSLTGAIIGLTVAEPAVALPAAFLSHFAMDAIPHFGRKDGKSKVSEKEFINLLYIDAFLCFLLVLLLAITRPTRWPMAIICAFLAALPDFFSINFFIKSVKKQPHRPGLYMRFAGGIQWFERPIGVVTEVVWFVAAMICLSILIWR